MYISSFRIIIFLIFISCQPWYKKLPPAAKSDNISINGVWKKNSWHSNPVNSVDFQDDLTEIIRFDSANKTFTKTSVYKTYYNGQHNTEIIEGDGFFSVSGNWILLTTLHLQSVSPAKKKKSFKYKMLYHYHKNTLLPMADDSLYQNNNFGIKDLISKPYTEDDIFFKARIIYTKKTSKPHVYYLVANH